MEKMVQTQHGANENPWLTYMRACAAKYKADQALNCQAGQNTCACQPQQPAKKKCGPETSAIHSPFGDLPDIFDILEECNVALADKATEVRSFIGEKYGKALAKTLLAQLQDGVRASHTGSKRRVYLHDGKGIRIKEQAA